MAYLGSYREVAATAPREERLAFIHKTYLHLGAAILAFVALEGLLVKSSFAESVVMTMIGGRWSWLLVLLAFMVVGTVARSWAQKASSPGLAYLGLGLYIVAEAFLFLPLLWIAAKFGGPDIIPTAGLITGIVFAGLTAVVFLSRADFQWMGKLLWVATLGALGVIIASMVFGFTLGIVFCGVMVVIAAGYILYDTSNVLHRYPIGSHVAASLALFASIAVLFWYVLQILMRSRR